MKSNKETTAFLIAYAVLIFISIAKSNNKDLTPLIICAMLLSTAIIKMSIDDLNS